MAEQASFKYIYDCLSEGKLVSQDDWNSVKLTMYEVKSGCQVYARHPKSDRWYLTRVDEIKEKNIIISGIADAKINWGNHKYLVKANTEQFISDCILAGDCIPIISGNITETQYYIVLKYGTSTFVTIKDDVYKEITIKFPIDSPKK